MLRRPQSAARPDADEFPLQALQLTCALGRRRILDGIDLSIGAGELVTIQGANGSGKTTLLKCLTGRLRPTSGHVRWFGAALRHSPAGRRVLGFAGHDVALYPELTLRENLCFAARMYALADPQRSADEALQHIGLMNQAEQLAGRLSRGMQQRAALARAFVHGPPIMILDEPFTSLDSDGCAWLEGWLIGQRARGRAILWTSHDDEQCRRLADRRLALHAGRVSNLSQTVALPRRRCA